MAEPIEALKALAIGLATTFKHLFRKPITEEYPEYKRPLPARTRARIILTRDLGILKHRQVNYGYLVRSDQVGQQLVEVLTRYRLFNQLEPYKRCMVCNGLVARVDKQAVMDRLEPKTRLYYNDFRQCVDCQRVFWRGSHFDKIEKWLKDLYLDT